MTEPQPQPKAAPSRAPSAPRVIVAVTLPVPTEACRVCGGEVFGIPNWSQMGTQPAVVWSQPSQAISVHWQCYKCGERIMVARREDP